jgi:hypothetical protein
MDSKNRSPDDRVPVPSHDPAASSFPPRGFAERDRDRAREATGAGDLRVTVCYSTGRTRTTVLRSLDDDQRRLIISVPWGQPATTTLAAIADQLTEAEQAEVAAAFGLRPQEP